VLFTKTLRMLADLGGGRADGTWEVRLRRYLKPDLLILDDFCLNPQQAEDLYQLIEERDRRGSMVVTSNRSPQGWYALFPNPVLAESALDQLINCAHQVILTGRSYRPMLRPDR
jgi:DNA replication protein DnaC